MAEAAKKYVPSMIAPLCVAAAVVALYAPVLVKLVQDWWTDENYSHGLLVPFVIAFVIWNQRETLTARVTRSGMVVPSMVIVAGVLMLAAGTLGSELFTQRVSLVVLTAGVVAFLFGRRVLYALGVPFALFLLAIPIPQIVFNRIALPLQMWASQMAVWGIRIFDVPTVRKGNVIDILPNGGIQAISLEVVEACSGIRSLMTLVTLALVMGYFTRRREGGRYAGLTGPDALRVVLLMVAAVPIAVFTNAARVTATGIMTYEYGKQATGAVVHDVAGWVVFLAALALLVVVNLGLKRLLPDPEIEISDRIFSSPIAPVGSRPVVFLVAGLIAAAIAVNALAFRSEIIPPRLPLSDIPARLGNWQQRGDDIRFGKESEEVLRATDYTMREYSSPDGRVANVYVGYYATQRSGATYHSPQNCLPGAGWVLSEPKVTTITTPSGRTLTVNRFLIENGVYREVMLYWYQGRGRTEASEYRDKLNTIFDSVTRRRSDGAMVRVMTSVGDDAAAADRAAVDLAGQLEDELPRFIPE